VPIPASVVLAVDGSRWPLLNSWRSCGLKTTRRGSGKYTLTGIGLRPESKRLTACLGRRVNRQPKGDAKNTNLPDWTASTRAVFDQLAHATSCCKRA